MMVASLAACGGGGDKETSGGADSGKDGGKELVYWSMWSEEEPQAKVIQEAVDKYTEDTGVKVDVQFKGRTDSVKVYSLHWMLSRPSTCLTRM